MVQVPVQVPVRNLQVPVPVQVLCINYWHSVTSQLHKVNVVASFIILCKKTNRFCYVCCACYTCNAASQQSTTEENFLLGNKYFVTSTSTSTKYNKTDLNYLSIVFQAIVVSRVTYALPAWYGQLSQSDTGRVNATFFRTHRWQLTNREYTIQESAKQADKQCFNCLVTHTDHCLQQLLPSLKPDCYQLRARSHSYHLLPSTLPYLRLFLSIYVYFRSYDCVKFCGLFTTI